MQTQSSPLPAPTFPAWRPKAEPWVPPDYDERVIYAVRALADGRATEGQQRVLFNWIKYATGVEEMSFRPGPEGERNSAFAEGKRFVGLQVMKMLHPALTPQESVADKIAKANKPKAPPVIHKGKRGKRNA